jgi:hypothetical protein
MVVSAEIPESVQRLEKALAQIRRRFPDLAVQAIPWMDLKHPIHPVQMELADPKGRFPRGGGAFLPVRFLRCLLTAGQLTLQLAFLQFRLRTILSDLKKKPFDLIAKTWAYPGTLLPGWNDFYYGDLQRRLSGEGVSMLLLTGKPSEMGWPDFAKASGSVSAPHQLPEMCLAPLAAPVRSVFRQLWVSLRLLKEAGRSQDDFTRRVVLRASRDCLSPAVTAIGLFYWIGREAVRLWGLKAVISLYEGYGWEQCLWRGAKEADPSCRTAGYQHTILLRHNLALLKPEAEGHRRLHPEVVLCLGPRTEMMLRLSHPGSELFPFGTFRKLPSPSTRREPSPEKKTVVVVPTGYPEEATLLFNVTLRAARNLPDHRFLLRSHPVLPFEQVLPALEEDPARFPNVEISRSAPIEEDFVRASAVLYRGSSSVLYAILYGLKPIYFSDGRFPDQDPLFEIDAWLDRVSSARDLEERLRSYAMTDAGTASKQWEPAAEYVASYTVPVGEESLSQLLSRLKIREREPLVA